MRLSIVFELCVLLGIAIAARLIYGIWHPPVGDELFQFLAALSWVKTGEMAIADGTYTRAAFFIILVGETLKVFGPELEVARALSLFFSLTWIAALFLWLRGRVGRVGAWVAAMLFALAPHSIELALFVRMYTLHGLIFLLATIIVFETFDLREFGKRTVFGLFSGLAMFALAIHLQPVTLIGILAISAGTAAMLFDRHFQRIKENLPIWITLSALGLGVLGVLAMVKPELVISLWGRYQGSFFASQHLGYGWYFTFFFNQYLLLWLLTPLLMYLAVKQNRSLGLFLSVTFLAAFFLHSFSGRTEERYIFYAVPLLFSIWGMGLGCALPKYVKWINKRKLSALRNFRNLRTRDMFISGMGILLFFSLLVPGDFRRFVNLMRGESYYFGVELADWEKARKVLLPHYENADVVVTTNFLHSQYHFARFDLTISPVVVHDIVGGEEFGIDARTGKPVISNVVSLKKVMAENSTGIVVGALTEHSSPLRLTEDVVKFLEKNSRRLDLPHESRLYAYVWGNVTD